MWDAAKSEMRGALFILGLILTGMIVLGHLSVGDPIIMILSNLRVHLAVLLLALALVMVFGLARFRGVVFLGCAVFALALAYSDLAPVSGTLTVAEPDLKVIAFNILGSNVENGSAIADFLLESDADLVFVNESGPVVPFLDAMRTRFPFQLGCGMSSADKGTCGDVLVLSRLELEEPSISRLTPASGHQTLTARVVIAGEPLNVVATHFMRPYVGQQQIAEFAALSRLVEGLSGPTVVAGDFNAVSWFGPFIDLLRATGLMRAAFEPGTWPVKLGDLGAPIDHVLVSGGAALVSLTSLPDHFGSNHRGLSAEIVMVPPDR